MLKQVCMGLALSLTVSLAQAAPLTYFEDDFSGYGDTLLNAPDSKFLGNWTTTNGTVDYIGVNDPSFGNPQNNGLICEINTACVDLDGSTGDAGVFSTAHTFQDGYYNVLFAISGNNRSGSDIVTVTFGNIVQQISLAFDKVTFSGAVEFGGIFNNILVGPNSPTVLSFSNAGGDNIGMLLKYVRIERVAPVPVPAAGGMLLLGLMGMAALRRRKAQA